MPKRKPEPNPNPKPDHKPNPNSNPKLARLRHEGYELGPQAEHARGETLIAALAALTSETASARGASGLEELLEVRVRVRP